MDQADNEYSTQKITPQLITKIIEVLKGTPYGSVEIYVENHVVTQISKRQIMKLARKKVAKKFSITVSQNAFSNIRNVDR
jgi:hypothetical protein